MWNSGLDDEIGAQGGDRLDIRLAGEADVGHLGDAGMGEREETPRMSETSSLASGMPTDSVLQPNR